MNNFLTLEEFTFLFRPLDLTEIESFNLRVSIVSDAIRQEAKNNNEDIDLMLENKEIYEGVLKEVTATVLARWYSQPSDMPVVNSSVDPYDTSQTWYNSTNAGIVILRKELKRLGVLRQKVTNFKVVE